MTEERNAQISKELFMAMKKNLNEFFENFQNEINSQEMTNADLFMILSSCLCNLVILTMGLPFAENMQPLKELFIDRLKEFLLNNNKLNS